MHDDVKIRPRKACNYPNLKSFGWVSHGKVGVLYSGKLGNRSEDLRSYPGLWWNRVKLRLYEGKVSEYSPSTCSIGKTCRGNSVSPPYNLTTMLLITQKRQFHTVPFFCNMFRSIITYFMPWDRLSGENFYTFLQKVLCLGLDYTYVNK